MAHDPSAHDEFEVLIPRMLRALRKLAGNGVLLRTSDVLDVLHDFYVEAWPGVIQRYDSQLGTFDRYAIAALLRFARVRTLRSAALRARVLPDASADALTDAIVGEPKVDEARVHGAIARLPEEHRRLIHLVYGEDLSERDVARQLGTTRYQVRLQLAEALAAIAAQFSEAPLVSLTEGKLAQLCFVDGEPIERAASLLGISIERARLIRRALLRRFARLASRG
ncbi:MAG TPA: sigma-70 family RNA polymerase sigma factor [Polyangiaceae bacterium]|nr:sigma-70 family RNA polymerase sigma factor [Polyangiaceae bacterium]